MAATVPLRGRVTGGVVYRNPGHAVPTSVTNKEEAWRLLQWGWPLAMPTEVHPWARLARQTDACPWPERTCQHHNYRHLQGVPPQQATAKAEVTIKNMVADYTK